MIHLQTCDVIHVGSLFFYVVFCQTLVKPALAKWLIVTCLITSEFKTGRTLCDFPYEALVKRLG